jgi:hypothetical protein
MNEADVNSSSPSAAAAPSRSGEASGPHRLSDELQHLIALFAERSVRVREVLAVLHKRGYTVLLILLAFPFCTPVPLPGVSIPFGVVIAFIGLRLALGQKPWLPARLLDTELPPKFFPRLLGATRRLVRFLEYFLRPRFGGVLRWPVARQLVGVMIMVCGLLMILPFPLPFSNGLPAMTVLLLASAMLEEDGCAAVAGGAMFVLSLAYFAAIFWGGTEAVDFLRGLFGDYLQPDDQPAAP